MNTRALLAAAMTGALCVTAPNAATADIYPENTALYGIDRENGEFSRYSFDSGELTSLGYVRGDDDVAKTGINASAYVPGFQNIYASGPTPPTNARSCSTSTQRPARPPRSAATSAKATSPAPPPR